MRAAVFDGPGKSLRICTMEDPSPGPSDVIVRTQSCGICGSDLHMTDGHAINFQPGCVMGHEFAGDVVAVGRDVTTAAVGDRVAVLPIVSCGHCLACQEGMPFHCRANSILGCGALAGGYAEYVRVPAPGIFRLPESLGYEDGALVEPLAVCLHGVAMAGMRPGARVLVYGAGAIGLGAAFWARRLGAGRIVMVAISDRRKALAQAMGADGLVRLEEGPEAVETALNGPPDMVFQCTGESGMTEHAIGALAPRGTVVVLGTCREPDRFFPVLALVKEVTLRFGFLYGRQDFESVLAALAAGALQPRLMVTGRVGLQELPEMFEQLRGPNRHSKVMIEPWRIAA